MCADVFLVSASEAVALDEDMPLLLTALAERGISSEVVCWDDPEVPWHGCQLALIRSTWDYSLRLVEFLDWAQRVSTQCDLVNGPDVLRWNTDKVYLRDLDDAGVNIVDSWFARTPEELRLGEIGEFVVKPTVGAGSRGAARFDASAGEHARAHALGILEAGLTVMVQPYQHAVDELGETAMLFFDGEFSHAINKGPLLAKGEPASRALFKQETISSHVATAEELDSAHAVIESLVKVPGMGTKLSPPLYARVDLVRANDGSLAVLELELTEPSVFLGTSKPAAGLFADAIARRLARN